MEATISQNTHGIRIVNTQEGRDSTSVLINKMYAWRGYGDNHRVDENPNYITLAATERHGEAVGTISVGADSSIGLLADQLFKDELDAYRARGAKVGEFTKLALDPRVQSKKALASLIHLATICARDQLHCTDMFIEINPRHRRFFEHMMGFRPHGELRINPRVNAPAYLLSVSLAYMLEQVEKYGGTGELNSDVRSFYPMFFSPHEGRDIAERLWAPQ